MTPDHATELLGDYPEPESEQWWISEDDAESYCEDCISAAVADYNEGRPEEEQAEPRGGYSGAGGDSNHLEYCERCGARLRCELTPDGAGYEIMHHAEYTPDLTNEWTRYELSHLLDYWNVGTCWGRFKPAKEAVEDAQSIREIFAAAEWSALLTIDQIASR
jgi:hypothetical protein